MMNVQDQISLVWTIPGEKRPRIIAVALVSDLDSMTSQIWVPEGVIWSNDEGPAIKKSDLHPIELGSSFPAGRALISVFLVGIARAIDLLGEPSSDNLLIFSDGSLGLMLQQASKMKSYPPPVVAVSSPVQKKMSEKYPHGLILESNAVDFIDRLKTETNGKGFKIVLVASNRPENIRLALGCAGSMGSVIFLMPILKPVTVDLHSTINYKSLTVRGYDFCKHLRDLSANDISKTLENFSFEEESLVSTSSELKKRIGGEDMDRLFFIKDVEK